MTPDSALVFVPDVLVWQAPANTFVVRVSSRIRTRRELFGVLRRHLRFPDYFGGNWDALNDVLHDLSWWPEGQRFALLHDGIPFTEHSRRSRTSYLRVIEGLIESDDSGAPARWTIVFPTNVRPVIQAELAGSGDA